MLWQSYRVSKSQVVSSPRRKILLSKWSSGRTCGAASTAQRPRSASERSNASTGKQTSKKNKKKEKRDKREKTEKKKDAQKEPNDLQ